MKHLDFTIDFETVGLTASAAPMMVAIVPWRREAESDPFVGDDTGEATEEEASRWPEPLVKYVDLRTCVVEGFDFDPETVRWWTGRSEAAKSAVCDGLAEPVEDVLIGIFDYLRDAVKQYRLESVSLWCQGMDVDIAILRNLCRKYDVDLEDVIPHTSFRDCRTVILETAELLVQSSKFKVQSNGVQPTLNLALGSAASLVEEPSNHEPILSDPDGAYKMLPPLPDEYARGSEAHDALYDALRSSWYTWQALKSLKQ